MFGGFEQDHGALALLKRPKGLIELKQLTPLPQTAINEPLIADSGLREALIDSTLRYLSWMQPTKYRRGLEKRRRLLRISGVFEVYCFLGCFLHLAPTTHGKTEEAIFMYLDEWDNARKLVQAPSET